jgi:hypothetical protein
LNQWILGPIARTIALDHRGWHKEQKNHTYEKWFVTIMYFNLCHFVWHTPHIHISTYILPLSLRSVYRFELKCHPQVSQRGPHPLCESRKYSNRNIKQGASRSLCNTSPTMIKIATCNLVF